MDLDRLNRWLTLLANLEVVAGLMFVAVQVQQGNHMAQLQREANTDARVNALIDMVIADPELIELMAKDAVDLTKLEAAPWESFKDRADPGFIDWFERNIMAQ